MHNVHKAKCIVDLVVQMKGHDQDCCRINLLLSQSLRLEIIQPGLLLMLRERRCSIHLTWKINEFAYWVLVSQILSHKVRETGNLSLITYDLGIQPGCYRLLLLL